MPDNLLEVLPQVVDRHRLSFWLWFTDIAPVGTGFIWVELILGVHLIARKRTRFVTNKFADDLTFISPIHLCCYQSERSDILGSSVFKVIESEKMGLEHFYRDEHALTA